MGGGGGGDAECEEWSGRTNFAMLVDEFSAITVNDWANASSGGADAVADDDGGDGGSSGCSSSGADGCKCAHPIGNGAPPCGKGAPTSRQHCFNNASGRTSLEKNLAATLAVNVTYKSIVCQTLDLLGAM